MRRLALRFFSLAAVASFAAAFFAAAPALGADNGPSIDLRGFHPSTDPASGIYLEPASSPATLDWNVGLWLSYVHRPITLRDPVTDDIAFDVIKHQLSGDLTASVGFARRFALGLDLPFVLIQTGDDPTPESTRVLGGGALPKQAIGDIGVTGKLTLVTPRGGDLGGFALALHERFTFPTGDEASYIGEGGVASETRLLAEYRLVAFGVHLAAGVKIRGGEERFACASISPPTREDEEDRCVTRYQHELPFGLGFSLRPQALGIDNAGRWTWFLEAHGHLPLSPVAPFSDGSGRIAMLDLDAGARFAIRDVSLLAGLGTSPLGSIGSPPIRATLSVGWAPRVHDADGDGVEDEKDQCRELAEDRDGFQDSDGCPELDNDDDGVPDDEDKCPMAQEDEDGFQDDDGCPDPDNDADSIPDTSDACPNEAGPRNADPKKSGCPIRDPDGDGIEGDKDKCPEVAEDKDGFEDDDGCPDIDNDDDGILDGEDACPDVAGIESTDKKERGCPDPDRDHDTIDDAEDKCPTEPEVWNGIDDNDGCPDGDPKKPAALLVQIKKAKDGGPQLEIQQAAKLADPAQPLQALTPTLRALSSELLTHPWTLDIGVRPKKPNEKDAEARAAAIVASLNNILRRDNVARVVKWEEVKDLPGALASGIGVKIVIPKPAAVAAPKP